MGDKNNPKANMLPAIQEEYIVIKTEMGLTLISKSKVFSSGFQSL